MNITENFSLEEMTASASAEARHLDNKPNAVQMQNLKDLCENVLEPLRELVGKPICVTSGFRSEKVNYYAGVVKNSQHLFGRAADISVKGLSPEKLLDILLESDIKFDQAIAYRHRGFLHVSYCRGWNRMMYFVNRKRCA